MLGTDVFFVPSATFTCKAVSIVHGAGSLAKTAASDWRVNGKGAGEYLFVLRWLSAPRGELEGDCRREVPGPLSAALRGLTDCLRATLL